MCIHSSGEGTNFLLVKFSTGIMLSGEGRFQGVNFSRKILYQRNLPEFLYEILLMSCFLFADSILPVEKIRVGVLGKFSPGLNCLENKSMGRRDFFVEV